MPYYAQENVDVVIPPITPNGFCESKANRQFGTMAQPEGGEADLRSWGEMM